MAHAHQVFTHHHVAAGDRLGSETPAVGYPSLLSSFGRLIAVASSVSNVDVYDANNVVELQHVLGSGACKFKLLGSFPVCDASGNVELSYVQFLSGGGLLVAGNTYQGSVIHVYRLTISATAPVRHRPIPRATDQASVRDGEGGEERPQPPAESVVFNTRVGYEAAPDLELSILPQLVYRAALPRVASVLVLPHPLRPHAFGVVLEGDATLRFYDAEPLEEHSTGATTAAPSPAPPTVGGATMGARGGSSGVGGVASPQDASVSCVTLASPITHAVLSRDGTLVAIADSEHTVTVFSTPTSTSGAAPATNATRSSLSTRGAPVDLGYTPIAKFVCESRVTSLVFMVIPAPADSLLFARFRYNHVCVLTGHENGFLNLWWLGNRGVEGAGGALATHTPVITSPISSFPPFHASRGAISHITTAVTVDDAAYDTNLPAATASSTSSTVSTGVRGPSTSTLVCVGAQGARGWRVYSFDHVAPPQTTRDEWMGAHPHATAPRLTGSGTGGSTAGGAVKASASAAAESRHRVVPNFVSGHHVWCNKGRRRYVPPAPRDTSHLTEPCVRSPTYSECLRAPIIGETSWSTSVGSALSAPVLGPGASAFTSHAGPGSEGGESASTDSSASEAAYRAVSSGAVHYSSVPRLASGVHPFGCAVALRDTAVDNWTRPYERSAARCIAAAGGGGGGSSGPDDDADDEETALRLVAAGLGRERYEVVSGNSAFRMLARAGHGAPTFSPPGRTGRVPSVYPDSLGSTPPLLTHGASGVKAKLVQLPRVVFYLLTERGIHVAGFDYHMGIVADITPAVRAAAALHKIKQRAGKTLPATSGSSVPSASVAVAARAGASAAPLTAPVVGGHTSIYGSATFVAEGGVEGSGRVIRVNVTRAGAEARHVPVTVASPSAGGDDGTHTADDAASPIGAPVPEGGAGSRGVPERRGPGVSTQADADALSTRARSYWPSAAVTSRVSATRRTCFDVTPPPLLPPSRAKSPLPHASPRTGTRVPAPHDPPHTASDAVQRGGRVIDARRAPLTSTGEIQPNLPKGYAYLPRHTKTRVTAKMQAAADATGTGSTGEGVGRENVAAGARGHVNPLQNRVYHFHGDLHALTTGATGSTGVLAECVGEGATATSSGDSHAFDLSDDGDGVPVHSSESRHHWEPQSRHSQQDGEGDATDGEDSAGGEVESVESGDVYYAPAIAMSQSAVAVATGAMDEAVMRTQLQELMQQVNALKLMMASSAVM